MIRQQKYPPPRVIAVDVDGTLHVNGRVNQAVVEYCKARKADGFRLMLWSARGLGHAQRAADQFGLVDLFDDIVSKPGYVLDDLGWSWIKYTRIISSVKDELKL
jgi:hydroxymethylpyrimidine pyrophosphatase-like HAD family hydrolase